MMDFFWNELANSSSPRQERQTVLSDYFEMFLMHITVFGNWLKGAPVVMNSG